MKAESAHHCPSLGGSNPLCTGSFQALSDRKSRHGRDFCRGHRVKAWEPRSPLHFCATEDKRTRPWASSHFSLPFHPTAARQTLNREPAAPGEGAWRAAPPPVVRCGAAAPAGRAPARPQRAAAPPGAGRAGLRGGSRKRQEIRGALEADVPVGVRLLRSAGGGGRREGASLSVSKGKPGPAAATCPRRDPRRSAAASPAGAPQSARCRRSSPAPAAAAACAGWRCGRGGGRPPGARRPPAPRRGPGRVSCSNKQ